MRLAHVCQPSDGGAARACFLLARSSAALGHRVVVIAPPRGELADWLAEAGIPHQPLAMSRAPGLSDLSAVRLLRSFLREADVVHLHSSKAGLVGRLALMTLRRRPGTVFSPHGWSSYVGGRLTPLYRLWERAAVRRTDVVVAVSNKELSDGKVELGRGVTKLRLIENGVDTDVWSPDGPVAPRGSAPLVVVVGRLARQKGQDLAVAMLPLLADSSAILRLVGGGPDHRELCAQAQRLGVEHRLELTGQTDPLPHLRAADVVLLPSRWEGLSLALLEAMATGCTIVATDVGGVDALAETGVVVPMDERPATLASAVDQLLADPDRREWLAREARNRAIDCYSLAVNLATHHELWLSLFRLPEVVLSAP